MHIDPPETQTTESQEPLQALENGRTPEFEEMKERQRETEALAMVERQKTEISAQSAEILKLRTSREQYVAGYVAAEKRIAELTSKIEEISKMHKETSKDWDQQIRAVGEELTQTKELLIAKSTELSGVQPFLSTTDRLSEADVLGIARDLNEHIFQVAANLTEEWEKLKSSSEYRLKLTDDQIKRFSQSYGPTLVRKVRDRNPAAVTFLVQSYLCDAVTQLTSTWKHNKELSILRYVYQHLSATEGQAVSARWRSITHSHLPEPSSHSDPLAQHIADILWITGLFETQQHSFDFVKAKVYNRIEIIDRLAVRLESVFMVDITSSDMYLLSETPCAVFDGTRMVEEFEPDENSTPSEQGKVVGTTEVGVEKSVGRRGERQRTQVLLKTRVVLEKDLADL